MTTVCPACKAPVDEELTLDPGQEHGTAVCSSCGAEVTLTPGTQVYLPAEHALERHVSKFDFVRRLGQGSFGDVWLAKDRDLGRLVALKLPKSSDKDAKLLHEAQTAARLRHPHIVAIYEVGVDDGQVFIASEFIDGDDLRSELSNGRLEVARAIKLTTVLARAIQHAHDHGVVHRDLKPANIILNKDGDPFITDFGIAKQLSVDETISTAGAVVGTVNYMSPEQARGSTRETDHRSDIYALGVVLFEMLTSDRPFRGNARAVIQQKIHDDPPSPRKLLPSLPKDLETICLKCLERDTNKRYSSAAALADELDRFTRGEPIQARPISGSEKLWRWCCRQPALAALTFSLFLSLVVGLIGVSFFWRQAAHNAERTRTVLYRTNMYLASKLWDRGDIAGLQRTLERYQNDPPADSLRGFEWRYFDALLEPFEQIVNHGDAVTDVAVSHDGGMFASVGSAQTIRVWNSHSGSVIRSLRFRAGRTEAIEFSPLDGRIATADNDGVVRLWHPEQHDRPVRELTHGSGLTHVRFSPDGRFLVSAGRNGTVRYWKIGEEELLATFDEGLRAVSSLRVSPDGRLIAIAAEDGKVVLWAPVADTTHLQWTVRPVASSLAFNHDGSELATGGMNGLLQIWSTESGERRTSLATEGGAIGDIEYLPGRERLALVLTNGEFRLLDHQQRTVRSLSTHALSHGLLAQSADGEWIAVGSGDGSVKLLRAAALERPDVFWHASHVRDLQFISDAEVAACAGDGAVRVWNVRTGDSQEVAPPTDREMLALALGPDHNPLAMAGMSREIQLWNSKSQERHNLAIPIAGVAALCFSRDGELLASGDRNGTVRIYASPFQTAAVEVAAPDSQVNDMEFTRDHRLAVSYSDGRIVFLDSHNGERIGAPITIDDNPIAIALAEHDSTLVVGTNTGNLCYFDVATRTVKQVVKAHSSRINAIALFPDGERLVSGGRDKDLRIWDVESRELAASFTGHQRQVFAIAISPDGRTIASGGLAGDIRIWRGHRTNP